LFRQKVRLVNIWLENIFFPFLESPKKRERERWKLLAEKGRALGGWTNRVHRAQGRSKTMGKTGIFVDIIGVIFPPSLTFFFVCYLFSALKSHGHFKAQLIWKGWFHVHGLLKIDW
jgi:hypothetical protein